MNYRPGIPVYAPMLKAVEMSGYGRSRIYDLAKQGRLTLKLVGRRTLVPMNDLLDIIEAAPNYRKSAVPALKESRPRAA